jgi:protein-disulfide isomerase
MRIGMLVGPLVVIAGTALCTQAHAQSLPAPDRDAIRTIVREYLIEHPEIIEEAMAGLRERRELERQARARVAIAEHREALLAHPMSPVSGAAGGDVTVVEFFDYRCPYCKRALGPIIDLLAADARVRVVWKEWPILGPVSTFAARAAMAADRQGRYHAFHVAVMDTPEELTEQHVIDLAAAIGLDVGRLRRDMTDPIIERYLEETAGLARALGLNGTPAFVIGDTLVPGAIDGDSLKTLVAEVRSGG